jgi:hypothetical protein
MIGATMMPRRPELLSSVLLRQNPHNVYEWHKRVEIYKKAENLQRVIYTYAEAVKTVEPKKATGARPSASRPLHKRASSSGRTPVPQSTAAAAAAAVPLTARRQGEHALGRVRQVLRGAR